MRERSVDVAGIRLHVRECGEGRPLLPINGIGAHVDMWAPLEPALPGTRLIAFDAPGTGRSATTCVPLSFEQLARLSERLPKFVLESANGKAASAPSDNRTASQCHANWLAC